MIQEYALSTFSDQAPEYYFLPGQSSSKSCQSTSENSPCRFHFANIHVSKASTIAEKANIKAKVLVLLLHDADGCSTRSSLNAEPKLALSARITRVEDTDEDLIIILTGIVFVAAVPDLV
jgi:hypothetical protein